MVVNVQWLSFICDIHYIQMSHCCHSVAVAIGMTYWRVFTVHTSGWDSLGRTSLSKIGRQGINKVIFIRL